MYNIFKYICLFHSLIDIVTGLLMIFYIKELSTISHGKDNTKKLFESKKGNTIKASEQLIGITLVSIGIMLYIVSDISDLDFQKKWCKGCILIHILFLNYRFFIQRYIPEVSNEALKSGICDIIFILTWVYYLIFNK